MMIQFFALSKGLSLRMGSVETTSTSAAATLPLFSASARSCSMMSNPRELFIIITPSFILAMFGRLMMPCVFREKRTMQHHYVRLLQQLVESGILHGLAFKVFMPDGITSEHAHAQRLKDIHDIVTGGQNPDIANAGKRPAHPRSTVSCLL